MRPWLNATDNNINGARSNVGAEGFNEAVAQRHGQRARRAAHDKVGRLASMRPWLNATGQHCMYVLHVAVAVELQ